MCKEKFLKNLQLTLEYLQKISILYRNMTHLLGHHIGWLQK